MRVKSDESLEVVLEIQNLFENHPIFRLAVGGVSAECDGTCIVARSSRWDFNTENLINNRSTKLKKYSYTLAIGQNEFRLIDYSAT